MSERSSPNISINYPQINDSLKINNYQNNNYYTSKAQIVVVPIGENVLPHMSKANESS
jgi:hypothetical protein